MKIKSNNFILVLLTIKRLKIKQEFLEEDLKNQKSLSKSNLNKINTKAIKITPDTSISPNRPETPESPSKKFDDERLVTELDEVFEKPEKININKSYNKQTNKLNSANEKHSKLFNILNSELNRRQNEAKTERTDITKSSISETKTERTEVNLTTTFKNYKQNFKNTNNIFEKIKHEKKKEIQKTSVNNNENILAKYFKNNNKNVSKLINTKRNPIFTKLNSENERQTRKNDLELINKLINLKKIVIPKRNFFDTSMNYHPSSGSKDKKVLSKSFDTKDKKPSKQDKQNSLNMSLPTEIVIADQKIINTSSLLTNETSIVKNNKTTINTVYINETQPAKKLPKDLFQNNLFALKSKFGIKKQHKNFSIGSVNTSVNSHSIDSYDITIENQKNNIKKKNELLVKSIQTNQVKSTFNFNSYFKKKNTLGVKPSITKFISFKKPSGISRSVEYPGNSRNVQKSGISGITNYSGGTSGSGKNKSNSSAETNDDIKIYNGPFDFRCISLFHPKTIKIELRNALSYLNIKSEDSPGNYYKLVCNYNKILFEVEIIKLAKGKDIYLVKFERIAGNIGAYQDICDKILIKLKL